MAWWREARFGMFIHWGLYAVPAGEWQATIKVTAGKSDAIGLTTSKDILEAVGRGVAGCARGCRYPPRFKRPVCASI
jgi:hypothetical protein